VARKRGWISDRGHSLECEFDEEFWLPTRTGDDRPDGAVERILRFRGLADDLMIAGTEMRAELGVRRIGANQIGAFRDVFNEGQTLVRRRLSSSSGRFTNNITTIPPLPQLPATFHPFVLHFVIDDLRVGANYVSSSFGLDWRLLAPFLARREI